MNYKKRIIFKNKKNVGHYILNPYDYREKRGKKLKIKSNISFEKGIKKLILSLKKGR